MPRSKKIGQHGKYDLHVLRRHGVEVHGYADDTMLESFVFNAGGDAATTWIRWPSATSATRPFRYEDVAGKGAKQIPFSHVAVEDATRYAAEDADVTLRLHRVLSPKLRPSRRWMRSIATSKCRWCRCWSAWKPTACWSTPTNCAAQTADLGKRMLDAQQNAIELAGRTFNLDSPKQLGQLLFDELKLPVLVKTPTGAAVDRTKKRWRRSPTSTNCRG